MTSINQIKQFIEELEQHHYWAEEFRKVDQWKQAIWDQHGRYPNDAEWAWYYDTQGPQEN